MSSSSVIPVRPLPVLISLSGHLLVFILLISWEDDKKNPARFIRWRFPEPIREALQKIRWWDWPLEKIHAARLEMKDPAAFVEKYPPEAESSLVLSPDSL
ncbi:MAG: hypothetical protein SPL62_05655 [Selenomonas sp.]|nr:hypothetical protein [Selenomonas sp.]